MVIEESKEADTSRGEATHRITRGVHDKVCNVTICNMSKNSLLQKLKENVSISS